MISEAFIHGDLRIGLDNCHYGAFAITGRQVNILPSSFSDSVNISVATDGVMIADYFLITILRVVLKSPALIL
jgi:hypothetical protein